MNGSVLQAKIFLSCGQNRASGEVGIAREIGRMLEALGYEVYIAIDRQSILGLRENILRNLEDSEYFLFVDFKRERLLRGWRDLITARRRGSLFCHQELAVASFLEKPMLGFREVGVTPHEGIMQFLQANTIPFSDRRSLPQLVAQKVEDEWQPHWKNRLHMRLPRDPFENPLNPSRGGLERYCHISVCNQHSRLVARNCYVYLDEICNTRTGVVAIPPLVEHKWAGYLLPNAHIRPGKTRDFDGFWIAHNDPKVARFNVFSDSSRFMPSLDGPGDFVLSFHVVSDNLASGELSIQVSIGESLDDLRVVEIQAENE